MSGFNNPTNRKRVEKIIEILELIGKSARSNKINQEEVLTLLDPVVQALGLRSTIEGLRSQEPEKATPEASESSQKTSGGNKPLWFLIQERIENAELKELLDVSYKCLVEIDKRLHDRDQSQ